MPLNHVALTVSDREEAAAFYGAHFGLTQRVHDDAHLLILAAEDGSLLALTEGEVPPELPRTNHFGFQLKSVDEVRAVRERLQGAGLTETEWQDDPGMVRVQVADPDGYRVEVFAFDTPAAPTAPPSHWTSFVADASQERPRTLAEEGNPAHRVRVEHNRQTLLVHLSDEHGDGWTVLAVDRATRRYAVVQSHRQRDAASEAVEQLRPGGPG